MSKDIDRLLCVSPVAKLIVAEVSGHVVTDDLAGSTRVEIDD